MSVSSPVLKRKRLVESSLCKVDIVPIFQNKSFGDGKISALSQVLRSALLYCMDFRVYGDWRSDLATRLVLFSYLGFYPKSFES